MWPRRRCWRACPRAPSGCRRASIPTRPRPASATCWGRSPSAATSTARTADKLAEASRSAWRASRSRRAELAAEAVDGVTETLAARFRGRAARRDRASPCRRPSTPSCRRWRAQALERGLEELDARQGFRGPVGHVAGKALVKQRAASAALRASEDRPDDAGIVEGIRDEPDRHGASGHGVRGRGRAQRRPDVKSDARESATPRGRKPLHDVAGLRRGARGDSGVVGVRFALERATRQGTPIDGGELATGAAPRDARR